MCVFIFILFYLFFIDKYNQNSALLSIPLIVFCEFEISVSKTELLNSLKITAIFTDKLNQTNLTILPEAGRIEIKTHNDKVGANTSQLSATISGEGFEFVINIKYLFEFLNSINSENINLRIVAPNKPIVVSGAGDQSFVYLIMPINR